MEEPSTSTPLERSSASALNPISVEGTLDISLALEDEVIVMQELIRLQAVSIVVHILGSRPSKGDLRYLLQASIQSDLDKVIDIQILGRGCYQLEFENGESVSRLLSLGSADLKGALAAWRHGFHTFALQEDSAAMFTCTTVFPNLEKEWRKILPKLSASIGKVLAFQSHTKNEVLEGGAPSVKLLCRKGEKLSQWIRLPKLDGNAFQKLQKVVYYGLPNQCYRCKEIGHIAKACPLEQDTTSSGEGLVQKSLQWQTVNRNRAFRGKKKIELPDRIYDNPLQHFPLLNTVLQAVEAHYEQLPIVDTQQVSMVREVGLCDDVAPMSNSSKVQKLVQHLENQSNMQVCPFKPEIQQISISKDIVPFSYVEIVRKNVEDHSKKMVLHAENVPIPYKFSTSNSVVEAVGNSKK